MADVVVVTVQVLLLYTPCGRRLYQSTTLNYYYTEEARGLGMGFDDEDENAWHGAGDLEEQGGSEDGEEEVELDANGQDLEDGAAASGDAGSDADGLEDQGGFHDGYESAGLDASGQDLDEEAASGDDVDDFGWAAERVDQGGSEDGYESAGLDASGLDSVNGAASGDDVAENAGLDAGGLGHSPGLIFAFPLDYDDDALGEEDGPLLQ